MCAPYGSMWFSYGLWNSRTIMCAGTARADAIYELANICMVSRAVPCGALEYTFVLRTSIRSGPYGARECTFVLY